MTSIIVEINWDIGHHWSYVGHYEARLHHLKDYDDRCRDHLDHVDQCEFAFSMADSVSEVMKLVLTIIELTFAIKLVSKTMDLIPAVIGSIPAIKSPIHAVKNPIHAAKKLILKKSSSRNRVDPCTDWVHPCKNPVFRRRNRVPLYNTQVDPDSGRVYLRSQVYFRSQVCLRSQVRLD